MRTVNRLPKELISLEVFNWIKLEQCSLGSDPAGCRRLILGTS